MKKQNPRIIGPAVNIHSYHDEKYANLPPMKFELSAHDATLANFTLFSLTSIYTRIIK